MATIRTLDLFCGAGGSSWGAQNAGATIVAGIDESQVAVAAYQRNFPGTKVICSKLESISSKSLKRRVGSIDLLLASPECTNHSPAKGSALRCEKSKRTALQVVRFAEILKPKWIVIENVVNMRRWTRYSEMLESLRSLKYGIDPLVLNAADFGVAQSRRRLFIRCERDGTPATLRKRKRKRRSIRAIVRLDGTYDWTPLIRKGRAKDTLTRARRAIDALGESKPFLLVYYGSDGAGGWQRLNRPLRTITTVDRFALVRPLRGGGHEMRMLQVPELKAAMGMPHLFTPGLGTRRDQIKAIGNAVCPPVMRAVVSSLTVPKPNR